MCRLYVQVVGSVCRLYVQVVGSVCRLYVQVVGGVGCQVGCRVVSTHYLLF